MHQPRSEGDGRIDPENAGLAIASVAVTMRQVTGKMEGITGRQAVGLLTDGKLDTSGEHVAHFLAWVLDQTITGHTGRHNVDVALQQATLLQMSDALQADIAVLVAFDETLYWALTGAQYRLIGLPFFRRQGRDIAAQRPGQAVQHGQRRRCCIVFQLGDQALRATSGTCHLLERQPGDFARMAQAYAKAGQAVGVLGFGNGLEHVVLGRR